MSDTTKAEIVEFLRDEMNICEGPAIECTSIDEDCPDHEDCGICRYDYMLKKGWLK